MKNTMKAKQGVELGQQLIAGTFAPSWGVVFVGRRPPAWLRPPAKRWKNIKLLDTEGGTLIDMRTDVNAVPHAGLS